MWLHSTSQSRGTKLRAINDRSTVLYYSTDLGQYKPSLTSSALGQSSSGKITLGKLNLVAFVVLVEPRSESTPKILRH